MTIHIGSGRHIVKRPTFLMQCRLEDCWAEANCIDQDHNNFKIDAFGNGGNIEGRTQK